MEERGKSFWSLVTKKILHIAQSEYSVLPQIFKETNSTLKFLTNMESYDFE